jgi:hypothetical protein
MMQHVIIGFMARTLEEIHRSNLLAERIVARIATIAQEEQAREGLEAAHDFLEYVIRDITATIVFSGLQEPGQTPELSPLEQAQLAAANLGISKMLIGEAVSEGFTQAYKVFCGRDVEHLVEIRLVDDGSEPKGRPA